MRNRQEKRGKKPYRWLRKIHPMGVQIFIVFAIGSLGVFQGLDLAQSATLDSETSSPSHDEHVSTHWSYLGVEGPDHWAVLQPSYRGCETGTQQSPIDIQRVQHVDHSEHLSIDYQTVPGRVMNTGNTIQFNFPTGSSLVYKERLYQLRQIHFHHPSEHQFHTFSYPMEMHMVHQDMNGHILVVGIFVKEGEANPILQSWWEHLPRQTGRTIKNGFINAEDLLPTNWHHFTYHGSLTTPPCSEGVQWVIFRTPISFSSDQIDTFAQVMGDNARPAQALHGRKVYEE